MSCPQASDRALRCRCLEASLTEPPGPSDSPLYVGLALVAVWALSAVAEGDPQVVVQRSAPPPPWPAPGCPPGQLASEALSERAPSRRNSKRDLARARSKGGATSAPPSGDEAPGCTKRKRRSSAAISGTKDHVLDRPGSRARAPTQPRPRLRARAAARHQRGQQFEGSAASTLRIQLRMHGSRPGGEGAPSSRASRRGGGLALAREVTECSQSCPESARRWAR